MGPLIQGCSGPQAGRRGILGLVESSCAWACQGLWRWDFGSSVEEMWMIELFESCARRPYSTKVEMKYHKPEVP